MLSIILSAFVYLGLIEGIMIIWVSWEIRPFWDRRKCICLSYPLLHYICLTIFLHEFDIGTGVWMRTIISTSYYFCFNCGLLTWSIKLSASDLTYFYLSTMFWKSRTHSLNKIKTVTNLGIISPDFWARPKQRWGFYQALIIPAHLPKYAIFNPLRISSLDENRLFGLPL